MKDSLLRDKSFAFALRTVRLNRYLVDERREYTLAKQVLRSGTSGGANVEEAAQLNRKVILFTSFQSLRKKLPRPITGCDC
ncbi:MAG: four helix bundle protein [Pyrinomonadaceae bacterium]